MTGRSNGKTLGSHARGSRDSAPPKPFVTTLYQYPLGNWVENIAIRASGELLLTLLNTPHVDQIDPSLPDPTPVHVYDFTGVPRAASVLGIAEIDSDIFAVAVGNYSIETGASEPGSWAVWRLDVAGGNENNTDVHLIADMPEALLLDGMGPFVSGLVGVNGMRTDPADASTLYFANIGQGVLARVAIDPTTEAATDKSEVVASIMDAHTMQYDDFAIRGDDIYLVTGAGNSIEKICLADGKPRGRVIVAGHLNSTEIAEPTSCAFGRTSADEHVLYVVTAGGLAAPINGTVMVGAQVLALDTRLWEEHCIY
ncbi:hypothetical protein PG988_015920 [Apiospora saccharicola]